MPIHDGFHVLLNLPENPLEKMMTYAKKSTIVPVCVLLGAVLMAQNACETDHDGDGWSSAEGDCDDNDASVHPGATEICDGIDNDCNDLIDDGATGDAAECAGSSCAAILADNTSAEDGIYYLDPTGNGDVFEAYCDMASGDGGWTLVAKLSNQDGRSWANAKASWTGTDAYGTTTDLSAGADAKSRAWGEVSGNEFMLTDSEHPGDFLYTNSSCVGDQTMSAFFTAALASFPYGGDAYYSSCTVVRTYWPTFATEPDWSSMTEGSSNLSLYSDYLVIARTDPSADTSGVVSFYDVAYGEADVGLAALENGTTFTDDGYSQDIGGPTSCSYSDSECATEYPETVFMWIR